MRRIVELTTPVYCEVCGNRMYFNYLFNSWFCDNCCISFKGEKEDDTP